MITVKMIRELKIFFIATDKVDTYNVNDETTRIEDIEDDFVNNVNNSYNENAEANGSWVNNSVHYFDFRNNFIDYPINIPLQVKSKSGVLSFMMSNDFKTFVENGGSPIHRPNLNKIKSCFPELFI